MNNKMEPPKRRRLKVVRACRECRRKKTKCDGEKTCSACVKSQTECQYISSKQVSSDHTLETIGTTTVLTSTRQKKHYQKKHQQKYPSLSSSISSQHQENPSLPTSKSSLAPPSVTSFKQSNSSSKKQSMMVSIHSIEKRLSAIEDQLKYIFQHHCYQTPLTPALSSSSSTTTTTSLPPLSSSLSPVSSPSSTSSKNDPIVFNDSSSSFIHSYQNEKNTPSLTHLLTLPPLQQSPTNSLYSHHSNDMVHKKIPLLQSIFHDR
ncbi:unnamed protein product [Cunninghamella blakesleeana]